MPSIETRHSGVFTFQVGVEPSVVKPLLDRIADAHARFLSLPIISDVANHLKQEVLASSIFATNAIDGEMLSEAETAAIINGMAEVKGVKERRVANIRLAYEKIEHFAERRLAAHDGALLNPGPNSGIAIHLNEVIIKNLHAMITDKLPHPYGKPGQYRDNQFGQLTKVGDAEHGGVYTAPRSKDDIAHLIREYLCWINSEEICTLSPLIRASLAHYYFERIHPFWEGNGRVGRILEMLILKCAGYRYAQFALSRFYLDNIDEYFTAFNMARQAEEKEALYPNTDFIGLSLRGMLAAINGLHDRANRIIGAMLYENKLNSLLRNKAINERQYTIINHLKPHGAKHGLADVQCQPWYGSMYRQLTTKTRSRDLKGLEAHALMRISEDKKIHLLIP